MIQIIATVVWLCTSREKQRLMNSARALSTLERCWPSLPASVGGPRGNFPVSLLLQCWSELLWPYPPAAQLPCRAGYPWPKIGPGPGLVWSLGRCLLRSWLSRASSFCLLWIVSEARPQRWKALSSYRHSTTWPGPSFPSLVLRAVFIFSEELYLFIW